MVIVVSDKEIKIPDCLNGYSFDGFFRKSGLYAKMNGKPLPYIYYFSIKKDGRWAGQVHLSKDFEVIDVYMEINHLKIFCDGYRSIARLRDIKPVFDERGLVWSLR